MPPIVASDDESDSSAPDQVPARPIKQTSVPESEDKMDTDEQPKKVPAASDSEDDDDEEGEDEYAVEQITAHKVVKNKVLYKIKWMGYDAEEDMTWEPVDNLDGAKDILKKYHESIGGDPQTAGKANKKSAKKADNKKRTAAETNLDSPTPNNDAGARKRGRKSKVNGKPTLELPLGSWEDDIQHIAAIIQVQDPVEGNGKGTLTTLEGLIQWNDGKKTQHKMGILRQKCPQKLCDYYEQHLVFSPTGETGES